MQTMKVEDLAKALDLQPHPEGGFFKEMHRSEEKVTRKSPFTDKIESRNASANIFFLMTARPDGFSAFHKIDVGEDWTFAQSSSDNSAYIRLHMIDQSGNLTTKNIGAITTTENENKCVPFATVPPNIWFAAEVVGKSKDDYVLVTCATAPAFDFVGFKLADQLDLIKEYPQHENIISRMTRIPNMSQTKETENSFSFEN